MAKLSVTSEQLRAAKQIRAVDYAQQRGYDLTRKGNSWQMREHDSMVFTENGSWFWNSQSLFGNAIDFAMYYEGMSLPEAVLTILNETPKNDRTPKAPDNKAAVKRELSLPPKAPDNKAATAYLCSARGLDYELVQRLISDGRLYQSDVVTAAGNKVHNAVFVGLNGSTPQSASLRGCSGTSKFKMEAVGSDKSYPFRIPGKLNAATLCVFESAIDAMSHASIDKISAQPWAAVERIAIGGNGKVDAITRILHEKPSIKEVCFCMDNDAAGRSIETRLCNELQKAGLDHITVSFSQVPMGKDWNEYLQTWRNIVALHDCFPTTRHQGEITTPCVGRIHFLSPDGGDVLQTFEYHELHHFANAVRHYRDTDTIIAETPEQIRQAEWSHNRRQNRDVTRSKSEMSPGTPDDDLAQRIQAAAQTMLRTEENALEFH